MKRMLCINTGGIGDLHGLRARRLTQGLRDVNLTFYDVDKRRSRWENMQRIRSLLLDTPWDLVYQEGTGIAGGLNLIYAARNHGLRYVVSSGDPIGGFFHTVYGPLHGYIFSQYERALYRYAAGFIGWTPYLTGMALSIGARRGVTVEGAVDTDVFTVPTEEEKATIRANLGIPAEALVCGVVGSIKWTPRQQYCYGLELIAMLHHLNRQDIHVLIVGDGNGMPYLRDRIPRGREAQVHFTGRVPEQEVAQMLKAMDIGFITQTLDGLGSFRLTTKLPEYLASGLAVAMSPIPGLYDYVLPAGWPLPAKHPATSSFHRHLAAWLDTLSHEEVKHRASYARGIALKHFSYPVVTRKFQHFIADLLEIPANLPVTPPASSIPVTKAI